MQCHPYLVSFLFIPSLYPSFINSKNVFYFLVSLLFLCMHAYVKSSRFIRGKGPRSLKKLLFCQTMVMLDYMCVQSFMTTHTQCFMLVQSFLKAGCYWLRLCYVAMTIVMLDYMCVQSFMITHNYGVHALYS